MSHLRNFILIITIVVSGCKNHKEVKIDNEDPTYFSSNIDLLSIQKKQNIELYTLNDTIKAKVQKNKNSYILKCVKKKRLFRKKNLILYPLVNNNFLKLADSIINLNNQLKENKLISVFTKKIKINNQFFLVQEDIDKILIESNDRREGKIFKVIFKN